MTTEKQEMQELDYACMIWYLDDYLGYHLRQFTFRVDNKVQANGLIHYFVTMNGKPKSFVFHWEQYHLATQDRLITLRNITHELLRP